jgi:hypothetical protein
MVKHTYCREEEKKRRKKKISFIPHFFLFLYPVITSF